MTIQDVYSFFAYHKAVELPDNDVINGDEGNDHVVKLNERKALRRRILHVDGLM